MDTDRPWKDDAEFRYIAAELWPRDWDRTLLNKKYDSGSTQTMTTRWQGWCAAKGKKP